MPEGPLIVFFDGKCPFCVGWVKFLLDRDGAGRLRFASLQSEWTRRFFAQNGIGEPDLESVAVWNGECLLLRSEALFLLAKAIGGIWQGIRIFRVLPLGIRDRAYDLVADNRNNWFRRRGSCWFPKGSERRKFLDLADPVYKDGGHGDRAGKPSTGDEGQGNL